MRKFALLSVLVLYTILSQAQQKLVTGRVTDAQGQPVPFATVRIKGAKSGVSADADGNFSIKAKPAETLIISGAGFQSKEVTIGDQAMVNVQVARQTNLDEVVVTALGVRRSRNQLPFAAQQISGDEVNRTITTNVVNSMSGKVAGLEITASNAMGGSSNTILRGMRSLTQSNQALYVIDGVPYDNTITTTSGYDIGSATADLNPDDIASIDVLKGGAASALYGSRGSNGVIVITTKRGTPRQRLSIVATAGVSAGSPDKSTLPTYQTTYGQGYEERNPQGFYHQTVGWNPTAVTTPQTDNDAATGVLYDPSVMVYNWDAAAPSDPNFHKATPWVASPHHNPTDYFVTPVTGTESILVTGGGEQGVFKLNYTRDDEKGFMPNSSLKKNMFDILSTYNINRRISVEGALDFVNEYATNRYLYQYTALTNPMTDFRQWFPTNVNIQAQKHDYFAHHENETWNWQNGAYATNTLGNIGTPMFHDNLYWFAYQNPENDSRNRYTGHVKANVAFTDWLSLSGTVSEDYYNMFIEKRADIGSQTVPYYTRINDGFQETNYNLTLNFNKDLGTDFRLTALLGGNIQKDNVPQVTSTTNGGLILPGFWSISNSISTPNPPTEVDQRKEIHSGYGQASLTWRKMIDIDASLRRDQSSTLPTANNVYYYPSVSGSFIFSELMKTSNWLSYGKFYANYAGTGGDAPYYYVYNSYSLGTPTNNQALEHNATSKPNQSLVPEKNKSYEFGLDLSFLNSRIGIQTDYYHSVQSNEIVPINVSTATGYNTFEVNGGSVQNQGVEVTLNLVPVRTPNFSWNMAVNWSKNMNKILTLYGGQPSQNLQGLQNGIQIVAEVGHPYGVLRGTDYTYKNGQKVISSSGYYVDSSNTLSDIGNIQPAWIGGINNSFTYKNLSLSFLLDFHQGGQVYLLDMDYGSFSGLYPRTAAKNDLGNNNRIPLADGGGVILPGVTIDGKPNTTRILENLNQGSWTYGSGGGAGSEANKEFVYDASYIKLREVAFTYSIPSHSLQSLHSVKGIDLSLSGRNLWIIHKNTPYTDPEQGQAAGNTSIGFQNGAYPSIRTVNFIVKLKF